MNTKPNLKPVNSNHNDHNGNLAYGLHKLIPNIMTLMALAAGLSGIQYAMDGAWEKAAIAIVIAAFLDTLDGATARLLNATSEFGAQLDSFSDFLAFGVAPSMILYLWILEESGKIGWIAMLVFAVASAMRLARYNITKKPKTGVWSKGFFAGVPAPAGAGMALLPLFIWLLSPEFFEKFNHLNVAIGIWVIFCAAMMVSRIPTWSSKQLKVQRKMAMPVLALAALLIAALIQAPWITLTICAVIYISTIPFSILHFRKIVKETNENIDLTNLALAMDEEIEDDNQDEDNSSAS
jgi:CDP-diacylglycerol--serine O-phosphatidyltransferase